MNIKKDTGLAVLSLLSWGALLFLISRLPPKIPMHWNMEGQVDKWGSSINLIWMGALAPGSWILMTWWPSFDPKKKNYPGFAHTYRIIRAAVVLLMMALGWLPVFHYQPNRMNTLFILQLIFGLFFIIMGHLLPKIQPNWFMGIKTPWTLSDPFVWNKTHRIGGVFMMAGGICFIVSALFPGSSRSIYLPVTVLISSAIFTVIYSAFLWKKRHPGESPSH